MRREKQLEHPGLNPLWDGLRREWRQQLLAGTGLLAFGVVLTSWGVMQSALLALVGLFVMMGAGYVLTQVLQCPPSRHRLKHLIFEEPHRIVWVYGVVTRHRPFGLDFARMGVLYFKLLDGDEISVSIPTRRLKLVSKLLARVLPLAVFGYTDERRARFQKDPTQLRRGAD